MSSESLAIGQATDYGNISLGYASGVGKIVGVPDGDFFVSSKQGNNTDNEGARKAAWCRRHSRELTRRPLSFHCLMP